jgi:hypothetical protein
MACETSPDFVISGSATTILIIFIMFDIDDSMINNMEQLVV